MATTTVSSEITMAYVAHDHWTESFVGTRHLVYTVLPEPGVKMSPEIRTLCQLALIGSHHLMEVALFGLLAPHAAGAAQFSKLTESLLASASYHDMLTRWTPSAIGRSVDSKKEPFTSTDRLRQRRNETAHKSSATANVPMARSALYSAVQGVKALYRHFGQPFPYEAFLTKWPIPVERMFSEVAFPR